MDRRILVSAICLLFLALGIVNGLYWGGRDNGKFIAVLQDKTHEVQTRQVKSLSWNDASLGEHFQYYDSVLTMADATATVTFLDGTKLNIGSDSLVVLEPPVDAQSALRINLKQGTAKLKLQKGEKFETKNKVVLAKEEATIILTSNRNTTEDSITVQEKPSGEVNQVTGDSNLSKKTTVVFPIEIQSLTNEQMSKKSNAPGVRNRQPAATNKKPLRAPNVKEKHQVYKLHGFYRLLNPRNLIHSIFSFFLPEADADTKAPGPHLEWETVPGASSYEIEVAEDASFKNVLITLSTKKTSTDLNLDKTGAYYWHVRAVDDTGFSGDYSELASLDIIGESVAQNPTPTPNGVEALTAGATPAPTPVVAPTPQQSVMAHVPPIRAHQSPTPAPVVQQNVVSTPAPAATPQAVAKASPADHNKNLFSFDLRETETWGSMSDSGGLMPSRSMLTSALGAAAGLRFRNFTPALYGEYYYSGQITPVTSVQNQNTTGQGYLFGAELKWQHKKYSVIGSYLFYGQFQLSQQTTLSQTSTYTQPSAYGLSLGYALSQNLTFLLTGRYSTFNTWNLGSDQLSQLTYGVGLSYNFH